MARCYRLLVLYALFAATTANAQISFEEVTGRSGINFSGRSMGASWGDYNYDGWPDLYTGNHKSMGSLYVNNGNGTFTNVLPARWSDPSAPDKHGAAWGDFDNDGDQDIMELSGAGEGAGSSPNLLLVNNSGILTDEAVERGVNYPLGRGRTPLWLDWNDDGHLDLFFSNLYRPDGGAPSAYFQQSGGLFDLAGFSTLSNKTNSLFAQMSELRGDGRRMLIIHTEYYPQRIAVFGTDASVDLRRQLNMPVTPYVRDVAIEDFNGDLRPDFYLATLDPKASDAILANSRTLKSHFNVEGTERGVAFKCNCQLTFTLGPAWEVRAPSIFIGAAGAHPSSNPFTVSASDAAVRGMKTHTAGQNFGLYIGYDAAAETWTVLASRAEPLAVNVKITASADITGLRHINLNPSTLAIADRLLLQTPTGFVAATGNPALDARTACDSVVAGDFDNDMDMDVYMVCRGQVQNRPNMLLENDGRGVFRVVPLAGGAAGSTAGRGDTAVSADFDNDGFLDLFITNGYGEAPYCSGPYQLFRNRRNANHWLELKLRGVQSNRDGVGAKVIVTAGGVSQLREQSGGVHRFAQNHQRLHFGLGSNTAATTVTVYWPSGVVQTLRNVAADRILQVTEPTQALR
ncbi:MAG TPA: CRTAC1 family protein [Steroidobacteraceae bacterium]|nr:CRTAC1 family protein [Steroidobacteraceae bacterium]